jgi:hypothetical protein
MLSLDGEMARIGTFHNFESIINATIMFDGTRATSNEDNDNNQNSSTDVVASRPCHWSFLRLSQIQSLVTIVVFIQNQPS